MNDGMQWSERGVKMCSTRLSGAPALHDNCAEEHPAELDQRLAGRGVPPCPVGAAWNFSIPLGRQSVCKVKW